MSDSDEVAQIIAAYTDLQVQTIISIVVAGLVAYEYVITFDCEVGLFWKRRITMSSALFFVNRYLAILVSLLYAVLPSPTTPKGCVLQFYVLSSMEFMQFFLWALFSTLRAYALSSRSWPLLIAVFLSSSVPLVVNYVGMGYASVTFDADSCNISYSLSIIAREHLTIVSRVCLIASDLLVMGITWSTTYSTSKEIKALGQRTSLSSILFRDGAIYFIVLVVMNVLHLSFSLLSIFRTRADFKGATSDIALFIEPITSVLISRFLIDLQEANNSAMHQSALSTMRSLNFDRVIGALASSLPAPGETSRIHAPDSGSAVENDEV